MKPYIVNLTNHLIGTNRFDKIFLQIKDPEEFLKHVKISLEASNVRVMSPAKLGEIMCSFEICDVMAGQRDLFNATHFSGDCEGFLRELVSLCLAYVIRDRLDNRCPAGTPRWDKGEFLDFSPDHQ